MAQLQKIMGFPELIWKSLGYMIYVLLKLCLENGKVFIETICRLPIPLFLSNSLCWMEPCRVDVHTDMHQQGPSYVKLLPARGDSERSSNRNNFHWDIETCETLEILLHSRNKCWSNWNGVIGKLPPPSGKIGYPKYFTLCSSFTDNKLWLRQPISPAILLMSF